MSQCVLCYRPLCISSLFCDGCLEVTKRLPKFLRSETARLFVLNLVQEASKTAEWERRTFPTTTEVHNA